MQEPLNLLSLNSHPPRVATRPIRKLFLDRIGFFSCRLCSSGDVCVIIIILHFINVSFVSLGPHHGPAQNFGRIGYGNRLRCHLWLTIGRVSYIRTLFLFPVKDGKLSTGVNATFNACHVTISLQQSKITLPNYCVNNTSITQPTLSFYL